MLMINHFHSLTPEFFNRINPIYKGRPMTLQKILICDDSQTDLMSLKNALQSAHCIIISANSADEALKKAKSEKPDVIFLDIVMPGMDGYAACRTLRNDPETKDIPVIFVSSKHQKADRVWAQMQGARDLIAKPFEPGQIAEKLAQI
jgi:twitching motility two-component system response regulator PilH